MVTAAARAQKAGMEEDDRRFGHARTALWRRVGDEVLVCLPGGDAIEVLDATAGDVWRLLAERPTLSQLSEVLAAVYGAPVEMIAADVRILLEELHRRGFVEEVVAGRD